MKMKLTFDSYAWIAYFGGKSSEIKDFVESDAMVYTPAIALTEIKHKYLREGHKPEKRLEFIASRSIIADISKEIALKAADLKIKKKLYTIDALIYSTSIIYEAKLVSGDEHFKGFDDVIFIKEG